jgi:Tol biopolymer transport system component
MTEARWAQVKAIFQAAVERPAAERAEFLAVATGGDELLRREVESLIRSDDPEASLTDLLQAHVSGPNGALIDASDVPVDELRTRSVSAMPASIGPYQVIDLLGTGGMGEVFLARDAKLNRNVALKLLPDAFAFDPDRLARFRREARALAALNHPHIAAIYGLEEFDRRPALVLELVEGVTLAERIAGSPLSLREALTLARQIAAALEAAHEKGIVHRDLKPANIKVTPAGLGKVLDFGLAKRTVGERQTDDAVASSLVAADGSGRTRVGAVVGTAAYMSPEQALGLDVDTRTDIWAFGCVLFEMLAGRKAFGSDGDADSTDKLLTREPGWAALPAMTPPKVRELLRRCLEKDPRKRLATIAEARQSVERMLAGRGGSPRVAIASAVVGVLAVSGAVFSWSRPLRPTGVSDWVQLTRFPDAATQPALSADGRLLAFIRGPNSTLVSPGRIYVKRLPDGEPVPLTPDGLAMSPVFSPDSTRIAYGGGPGWDTWAVSVAQGAPYPWLVNASGLTWHGRGEIMFSEIKTGQRGAMGIVTSAESRDDSRVIYFPTVLGGMAHRSYRSPDGRSVLITEMDGPGTFLPCRLVPFDGSSTGHTVGPPGARCSYAGWSPDGRWMYFSAAAGDRSHLWRQRFPDGPVEQLTFGPTEEEGLAVSRDGRSLVTSVGLSQQAVWLRDGAGERQLPVEGYASVPRLSADGHKVFYLVTNRAEGPAEEVRTGGELRVTDVKSGRTERLLPGQMVTGFDLSRDDRIVAAVVDPDGGTHVWLASADGRTSPRRVPTARGSQPRFGPAGEILFRATGRTPAGLWRIQEDGSAPRPLNTGAPARNLGTMSPDGQWIGVTRDAGTNPPIWLFSLSGAEPVLFLQGRGRIHWAHDGSGLYVSNLRRTYVLPLASGTMLPAIPPGGFRTYEEIAALKGVEIIPAGDVGPGPSASVYVFSRTAVARNIFQIPIR